MVSHQPAKFGGYKQCGNGDIRASVCQVIFSTPSTLYFQKLPILILQCKDIKIYCFCGHLNLLNTVWTTIRKNRA